MNDEELLECANCGYRDTWDNLPDAKDLWCRLSVGDTYSDVECPECGALCYPVEN